MADVTVIGGGFAGCEAAWAAAQAGARVTLVEMRPGRMTPAHRTGDLAEMVCSNSLKSDLVTNASGVLKREMRMLGSVVLDAASRHAVPAGEALAVDRDEFAAEVTARVSNHPRITVERAECVAIPDVRPAVIATGPLTTDALANSMRSVAGDSLAFYDAVAPTVTLESLDTDRLFRASRRGRGITDDGASADYLNAPMDRAEYEAFHAAMVSAETAELHEFETAGGRVPYFEMCVPVEELARRGPRTLAYGPMKPIGLTDPRTGGRPWAVVQLRQENRAGTLYGLVGFQTRLKWPEQRRIFRMIPGLENAEFVRYGVMHRNTYLCAPRALDVACQLRGMPGVFVAGQLTGVEGYLESAGVGIIAGLNAARAARGVAPSAPPRETVLGSLLRYLVETEPARFAPMNSNWGIVPDPPDAPRDKRERAAMKARIALAAMAGYARTLA